MRTLTIFAAATLAFQVTAAQAQKASVERGRGFADTNCMRCHAIGVTGDSPVAKAPPFRTLHNRYPIENLRGYIGRRSSVLLLSDHRMKTRKQHRKKES